MADDRRLDPVTGDLVDATAGAFEQCDVVENMIAFSFMVPLGSWEGDPDLGHRFNELANATDTQDNRNKLRDFAGQAVQWIMDLGLLDHLDVTVESFGGGVVAFEVDYYLPGKQQPKRVGFAVPVGAG